MYKYGAYWFFLRLAGRATRGAVGPGSRRGGQGKSASLEIGGGLT